MKYASMKYLAAGLALMVGSVAGAAGPSSSLYVAQEQPAYRAPGEEPSTLSPAIAQNSFYAVQVPEPRQFAQNDLVTVIIRESFKTDLKASLETKKDTKVDGEITDFIDVNKLLEAIVEPNTFSNGNPAVGVNFSKDWNGDGDYSREESMTGRMTARVADVKPNGTLVLEARQTMINDKEEVAVVLTGTCRAADVTIDNTVLSTELYDLHLDKQHKGSLKETTRKGLITKIFDALFAF